MLLNSLLRLSHARMSTLAFTPNSQHAVPNHLGPRLGQVHLHRKNGISPRIHTPALITATSRGLVPHLSQDHVTSTKPIGWTDIHFESFLEHIPPIPTLQNGRHPLHEFLQYSPEQHILSLSVRDPHDGREMPPNGKDFISAFCIRGVRKMSPSAWKEYVLSSKPDVVTALSDIPFAKPPHSQKRTTKSLERSTAWLAHLLHTDEATPAQPLNILVQMAGGTEERARQAFAECLVEALYGKDLDLISPLKTLDEGVCGYVFDLVPLRASIQQEAKNVLPPEEVTARIQSLMSVSLRALPVSKLRIVHSAVSPHEILRLIRDVGVDLFDARWAHLAANLGVALDFCFPVRKHDIQPPTCRGPDRSLDGKLELGHNLFSPDYAHDHTRFASTFYDACAGSSSESSVPICPCAACSPIPPAACIEHSAVDAQAGQTDTHPIHQPPFTRAYIHHLLHTHEMSSHALLAMHNLTVMDAFFAGIREVLSQADGVAILKAEVEKFAATYSEDMTVLKDSRVDWARVERERGKGRMMREKETVQA